MNKQAIRILSVAVIAAAISTAFAVGQSVPTSDATSNDGPQERTSEKHSNEHTPSFAARNDLNQTKVTELRIGLHDLWVEHVVWTRQYIVAAAADSPDAGFAAERLLKNQDQIGDAIEQYYGDEAGEQLTSLLKDHILIAVDLLEAAKAGDQSALEQIEEKWYDNADDIASFLSEANPNWIKADMVNMLNEHLLLTKTEAVARLTGDYATDVENFDALYKHAVSMSDAFASGIVAQFQEQFAIDHNIENGK